MSTTLDAGALQTADISAGQAHAIIDAAMRKATGKDVGDTLALEVHLDLSRPDPDMPEELAAALADRPGGWEDFERLPDGMRRQMLAYVGAGKRVPTREKRSLQVLEMLAGRRRKGL